MITDDQVVAMFAEANPVRSLDLLDPIEPVSRGHLENRSERSSEMTDARTIDVTERRRWPGWAAIVVVVIISVVAVPTYLSRQSPVSQQFTPAETVVLDYLDALSANDVEVMHRLVSSEATDVAWDDQTLSQDWQRATGIVITPQGCTERTGNRPEGTLVDCTNTYYSDWHHALGLEPSSQATAYLVRDGKIRQSYEGSNPEATADQDDVARVWNDFRTWVAGNHGADLPTMYDDVNGGPRLTPESIALWEQYTNEFVAEMTD